MTGALHSLGTAELAQEIAAGRVRAADACEHYLERIGRINGEANAYTVVLAERARVAAARADARQARGEPLGPLHGVPFAVKDLFAVQGIPTTAGSRLRADDPPAEADAAAVARMTEAGSRGS